MAGRLKELEERLAKIETERANLQEEIRLLQAAEASIPPAKIETSAAPLGRSTRSTPPQSNSEKLELSRRT